MTDHKSGGAEAEMFSQIFSYSFRLICISKFVKINVQHWTISDSHRLE